MLTCSELFVPAHFSQISKKFDSKFTSIGFTSLVRQSFKNSLSEFSLPKFQENFRDKKITDEKLLNSLKEAVATLQKTL